MSSLVDVLLLVMCECEKQMHLATFDTYLSYQRESHFLNLSVTSYSRLCKY